MAKPARSVAAGTLGGALTTVIISVLEMNEIQVPADLAAAICTLVVALLAHFIPDKAPTHEE